MSLERRFLKRAGALTALVMVIAPVLAACGGTPTATAVPATPTVAAAPTDTAAAEQPTATSAGQQATATTGTAAGGTATTGTGKPLKVGLVTDVGRLNDKSFNQSSWEGVQQAEKDLGVEIKAIETADPADYAK